MKQVLSVLALVLLVAQVNGTPLPYNRQVKNEKEQIMVDQRQEGEFNIRADLKNFVILIIPKMPSDDSANDAGLGLIRSHGKHHAKHVPKYAPKRSSSENNEVGAETLHFIESKTAPYHVDIGKSDSHLLNDEILATQTPPVALALKTTEEKNKRIEDQPGKTTAALLRQLRSTRFAKAFVLTVPEEDFVLTKMEENKKVVKKDGLKNKPKKAQKEELTLLGASEQCGPEMYRDGNGVCRLRNLLISASKESMERDE